MKRGANAELDPAIGGRCASTVTTAASVSNPAVTTSGTVAEYLHAVEPLISTGSETMKGWFASMLVAVGISGLWCVGPALAQGRNIPEALRAKCAQQAQQQAQAAQIRGYGAGRARKYMFNECVKNGGR